MHSRILLRFASQFFKKSSCLTMSSGCQHRNLMESRASPPISDFNMRQKTLACLWRDKNAKIKMLVVPQKDAAGRVVVSAPLQEVLLSLPGGFLGDGGSLAFASNVGTFLICKDSLRQVDICTNHCAQVLQIDAAINALPFRMRLHTRSGWEFIC